MHLSIKIKFIILIIISTLALIILDYLFDYQSKLDSVVVKMSFLIVLLAITNYFVQRQITEPLNRLHDIIVNLKDNKTPLVNINTNEYSEIDLIGKKLFEVISLLKTKEDDLTSQIKTFEDILQSLMASIIVTDKTLVVTYCNVMAEKLFGFKTNEMIGKSVMNIHQSEKISDLLNNAIKTLEKEEKSSYSLKRTVDNKKINLESTLSALRDKNETLQGYVIITIAISDIARQQTRLHLQYKISKILVESINMEEALREVLKEICKGMMWDHGEIFIIDKKSGYLKYDIRYSLDESQEKYGRNTNDSKNNIIFEIKGREQKIGSITFTSKILYNFDDELKQTLETISKLIGVFVEKQETEESIKSYSELLLKKNKELEEFAYVASHDLQQPLRLITGFSQLLESRLTNKLDAEEKELMTYIVSNVNRMQNLIEDLLSYSRLTTHERPFSFVNLLDIIKTAKENIQHQVDNTGAEFLFDNNIEFIEIYCEPTQMVQVFQNIFDNAIKYRQPDIPPVIKIDVNKSDERLVISISDNGIGFDISQAEKIFKIFHRLHNDDKYPGTGIGLSICKKIIERHQGIIWVESEVGKGSTFYISIYIYPKQ